MNLSFSMWPLVSLALLTLTVPMALLGQDELPKDYQPPYSEPPKLALAFNDEFGKDTRGNYEVSGKDGAVAWEQGKLTLGEGANLLKQLDAGSWVEIEFDLEFPELTSDGQASELKVWLDLEGATDSFVRFREEREKGETKSDILVVDSDGHWNQDPKLEPVGKPFEIGQSFVNGKWKIRFRRGLWTIAGPDKQPLYRGYIKNGKATVNGFIVNVSSLAFRLGSIRCDHSSKVKFEPTPEIKERLKDFNSLSAEMAKSFNAGKTGKSIVYARRVVETHESLLGMYHPGFTTNLFNLARLYRSTGAYARAAPYCAKALQVKEQTLGKDHPEYADSLNNLAALYLSMGEFSKAEPLMLQALSVVENSLGKESSSYALSLNNLSAFFNATGQFEKAQPFFIQAAEIRKNVLGKDHPDYALSLNNLASNYFALSRYQEAVPLYRQALQIREKSQGKKSRHYASTLGSLAKTYVNLGRLDLAKPLLLEAKAIHEKVLSKEHPDFADSLNDLAELYRELGDYDRAETLFRQAISLAGKSIGKFHPTYANYLNNLGGMYVVQGDYVRAEPLLNQARSIMHLTSGPTHPGYAASLNNLAALNHYTGNLEKAAAFYSQANEVFEKVFGQNHPNYARSLSNLAAIHESMEEFETAELNYSKAAEIMKKVFGAEHPEYASSIRILAALYLKRGQLAKAEPLYLQGLEILKKKLGEGHKDTAYILNDLAFLYQKMGEYDKSVSFYRKAQEIFDNEGSKDNFAYADNLSNQGYLSQEMGNSAKALKFFDEATSITHRLLERFSVLQSEKQRRRVAKSFQHRLSAYISNALRNESESRTVWDKTIQWKGMSFVRQKQNMRLSMMPQTKETYEELKSIKSQMSNHLRANSGTRSWKDRQQELEESEDNLERKLAGIVADLKLDSLSIAKKEFSIPKNTCFVDYQRFWYLEPDPARPAEVKSEQRYLALVYKPDNSVKMLDLGSAKVIEKAISQWRNPIESANKNRRSIDPVSQMAMDRAGAQLRKLLWEPLENQIGEFELVIVSPDGALGRLPLIALPGKEPETYLLEEKRIVYFSVPALLPQMLSKPAQSIHPSLDALLVGGINYGESPGRKTTESSAFRNLRILQELKFGSLKQSAKEIDEIKTLLPKASILTTEKATEKAFHENIQGKQVVHIATHGFFQSPDRFMKRLTDNNNESLVTFMAQADSFLEQAKVLTENPNLLSGLAFANANSASSKKIDEGDNDGILYSAEIAMIPMEHVEMAVLSACETSLGTDDNPGEGLMGIQRAFQIAGAKSTIASYWKVSDSATQMLMNRFYRNLIAYGEKAKKTGKDPNSTTVRIDALRDAQIWMLRGLDKDEITQLNLRGLEDDENVTDLKKKKSNDPKSKKTQYISHPRYWAAFVLSGDWR